MEFVNLKAQYEAYKTEIDYAIQEVLSSTQFINGPQVKELEEKLANYCGVKHAIACSSGTDAILLPLMAKGVGIGDEIIVPDFTFIATAEVVALLGAKPVFVDVDEETFNINPKLIEKSITKNTKGIIAVSLYGQCADFDEINEIAKKHNLFVIEDAAQSFGATYKNKKSCNLSEIATTSFFPAKPLGCYGDGGAVFTNDSDLAQKMRVILNHGQIERYKHSYIGINGRLDTLQAAILIVKLKYFDEELKRRNEIAEYYTENLKNHIKTPTIKDHNFSSYAQYTVRSKEREKIIKKLKEKNIPTAIHYPIPLHRQKAFENLTNSSDYPISEILSNEVFSLPMHPFLNERELTVITETILLWK